MSTKTDKDQEIMNLKERLALVESELSVLRGRLAKLEGFRAPTATNWNTTKERLDKWNKEIAEAFDPARAARWSSFINTVLDEDANTSSREFVLDEKDNFVSQRSGTFDPEERLTGPDTELSHLAHRVRAAVFELECLLIRRGLL